MGRGGCCCVLQALHCGSSSWVPSGFPAITALLAGSCQPQYRAAGMGKTSLCRGRKLISISYCTSCRLRHGELSGKTIAPSSCSCQAMLRDAEAQPVKSPKLRQPPPPCPGLGSGSSSPWLAPSSSPRVDTTMGPAHPGNLIMGLQGNSSCQRGKWIGRPG